MEQLQHDPRTKQQIKDTLYAYLYLPVQNQFKTQLELLIIRNTLINGTGHKSFHYKGEYFCCDSNPPPRKWNRLDVHLRPAMNEYLAELKQLNEGELPFVMGFINQVLNASNNFGDYLQLLPDAVHPPIEQLMATCPCHARQLSNERVTELRDQNQLSIQLMKKRMVMNLIT